MKAIVTGAFGYSGKYIAKRLLDSGWQVGTLTNSTQRENQFEGRVSVHPFNFDDPAKLTASLEGVSVLINTYWVRFNYKDFTHSQAVKNTLTLFEAAKKANVKRVVHVSISNPSENSKLEYFKGKAKIERALIESGLSYAILRPTVLFGKEDILINSIACALRRFPVFTVFGNGLYKLQPIYVDDLAKIAVEEGNSSKNTIIDAIGPETFTYLDLVRKISETIGKSPIILPVPPSLGYVFGWVFGKIMGDVMITREEITGLMANLLCTDSPPAGSVKLTDWMKEHSEELGLRYSSELARRVNRKKAYENL